MKSAQGSLGRVFVLRLEDGDRIPEAIEAFARDNDLASALVAAIGGLSNGRVVTGPRDGRSFPPESMLTAVSDVHEAAAVGTIVRDESGVPRLHMHAALGRDEAAVVGCVRPGLDVWTILEVVLIEIVGLPMTRRKDAQTGFALLSPDDPT